jgi:hypothetical protein
LQARAIGLGKNAIDRGLALVEQVGAQFLVPGILLHGMLQLRQPFLCLAFAEQALTFAVSLVSGAARCDEGNEEKRGRNSP